MEILVAGFNFFVLMNSIYEPLFGHLVAHQIGMYTRILVIFIFSYMLLRRVKEYETVDLIHVGFMWLGLTLVFEWGGSFAIGRPVEEILIGWNIFAGYRWPFVLLAYLSSTLIVGTTLRPGKNIRDEYSCASIGANKTRKTGPGDKSSINESDNMTILFFIASTFAILLSFMSLYRIGVVQAIQEMSKGLIHSTLLSNALLLVGAVYLVLINHGEMTAEDLGLRVEKLPLAVAAGIVIWASIQILEGIAGYAISGTIAFESSWRTEGTARIGLLTGMLFGTALFEEVGFRGFLLVQFMAKLGKVVENRTLSISLALLASQTFFTLVHVPWKVMNQGWTTAVILDLMFSVFMNGMIYGLFYLRTRNLFFVMIVHALGNAPSLLIEKSIEPSILLLLLSIICCAVWPKLNASASIWLLERKEANLPPEDSTGNVG